MSASELRAELRALRKESVKPVSKMRVRDISAEIERLKVGREETPAVASTPSSRPRSVKPSVESIKEAKASEFPVEPSGTKKEQHKTRKAPKEEEKKEQHKTRKAPKKEEEKPKRPAKGSEEMKAKMKALREKKKAK